MPVGLTADDSPRRRDATRCRSRWWAPLSNLARPRPTGLEQNATLLPASRTGCPLAVDRRGRRGLAGQRVSMFGWACQGNSSPGCATRRAARRQRRTWSTGRTVPHFRPTTAERLDHLSERKRAGATGIGQADASMADSVAVSTRHPATGSASRLVGPAESLGIIDCSTTGTVRRKTVASITTAGIALPPTPTPAGRLPRSNGSRPPSQFRTAIRFGTSHAWGSGPPRAAAPA